MNKVIVYQLYANKTGHHDLVIYTLYHLYHKKYIDVISNEIPAILITNYQRYFNSWFEFYKAYRGDGVMLDIIKHMLDYYVAFRIQQNLGYDDDHCFICKRRYSRDKCILKNG